MPRNRQEQEEVCKNTKTPFSGGLPHSERQRAVKVPQASEGKALLKTRPHQTSILRAKGKYPEVGEGDGGESSMPVHGRHDQDSWSSPGYINSFQKSRNQQMQKLQSPPFGITHHIAFKFPNVTKQKGEAVFLSMILMSSHPAMTSVRVEKGGVPRSAFTAAFHTFF